MDNNFTPPRAVQPPMSRMQPPGHYQGPMHYPGSPVSHWEGQHGQGPPGHGLNHPPGPSSIPSHHDASFYPHSQYPNFSVPPPNFQQPPPGFPPPPSAPFIPQNVPQHYPSAPYNYAPRQSGDVQYTPNSATFTDAQDTEDKQHQRNGKDSDEDIRSRDEAWLSNWLHKTGAMFRIQAANTSYCVSIPDSSLKLRRALHLLEKLQKEREYLKEDDCDVMEHQSAVHSILTELADIKQSFLTGGTIDALVKRLDRAGKKRRRHRRQKRETLNQQMEEEKRKEALHKVIDEKMAADAQKIVDEKKELEVKAAADLILAEVRRKVQEASKAVDLTNALTKLRSLRKDAAQRKGVFVPPDSDETYHSKIGEMEKLLKQQLAVYEREKKALEVMLEQEQEEDKEKEKELQRLKELQEIKKLQKCTETWLFGPKLNLHPEDPMHKFRQYYEMGENNIHNLMKIRHAWDSFLVPPNAPEGSPVPFGWVQPTAPSSSGWEAALVKEEAPKKS